MPLNCGAREDSCKSPGQQGDQTNGSEGRSTLNIHWKDWCWSWSSSVLVIWWELPTNWKSPWCWERLRAEEEEGAEDEMAGWHQWCNGYELGQMDMNFRRWWGMGRPGCSPWGCSVGHDRATEQQQVYSFSYIRLISYPLVWVPTWFEIIYFTFKCLEPVNIFRKSRIASH